MNIANILLSETEALDKSSVSFDILLCKICKKLLSVTNHLGETSLRVEVLGVLLHVLGELIDSGCKNSNLNLGRTCVLLVDLVLLDESRLLFLRNHLSSPFLKFYFQKPSKVWVKSAGYARNYLPNGTRPYTVLS